MSRLRFLSTSQFAAQPVSPLTIVGIISFGWGELLRTLLALITEDPVTRLHSDSLDRQGEGTRGFEPADSFALVSLFLSDSQSTGELGHDKRASDEFTTRLSSERFISLGNSDEQAGWSATLLLEGER